MGSISSLTFKTAGKDKPAPTCIFLYMTKFVTD